MKRTDLATIPNLHLAWERITRGTRPQYKRYYRDLYYAYGIALDQNLRQLRERIIGGSYQPSSPDRIYTPKSSGLLRPITLLRLEDQIVLQAYANLAGRKMYAKRKTLLLDTVFSNVVVDAQALFMVEPWWKSYAAFQRKIARLFKTGYIWSAEFDLAAFYDTISHDLLFRCTFPRISPDRDDSRWFLHCLMTWSSCRSTCPLSHGIPQGPLASDLLAEVFMLPIDLSLHGSVKYVRYVDDIRIFGRTERETMEHSLQLEQLCRDRGLIPNSGKFSVKQSHTVEEATGVLPSVFEDQDRRVAGLSEARAVTLLDKAVDIKTDEILDKSRLRFVLFRAPPSGTIVGVVLQFISTHPENIDAYSFYLGRCIHMPNVIDSCILELERSPYEYVQGEMLHLVANSVDVIGASDARFSAPLERSLEIVKSRKYGFAVRWAALRLLCALNRHGLGRYSRFVAFQDSVLLQALVIGDLPDNQESVSYLLPHLVARRAYEPALSLIEHLVSLEQSPEDHGIDIGTLPDQAVNFLRAVGLWSGPRQKVDSVGEILSRRYGVSKWGGWQSLLGSQYKFARSHLIRADRSFEADPSHWQVNQNSFNQTLFLALQKFMELKGIAGTVTLVDKKGQLVEYGVTLDPSNAFSKLYPVVADALRVMNSRRNRNPVAHPYDKKTGRKNEPVTPRERKTLAGGLEQAYAEIMTIASS